MITVSTLTHPYQLCPSPRSRQAEVGPLEESVGRSLGDRGVCHKTVLSPRLRTERCRHHTGTRELPETPDLRSPRQTLYVTQLLLSAMLVTYPRSGGPNLRAAFGCLTQNWWLPAPSVCSTI